MIFEGPLIFFLQALRVQSKPARFRSLPSNDDTSFLKKLYHSTYYQVLDNDIIADNQHTNSFFLGVEYRI